MGQMVSLRLDEVELLSTPVKTSPPQALLSASSWTSDITLGEAMATSPDP